MHDITDATRMQGATRGGQVGWGGSAAYNARVKKTLNAGALFLAVAMLAGLLAALPQAAAGDPVGWNPKAAAAYLDQRQDWWQKWPPAARDRGTFCVSCHTAATYALARPALRGALGEAGPGATERALQENVTKRVTMWKDVEPFYPDQTRGLPKTSESRGTEAILNALILSGRDARSGSLTDDTRRAFDNLWALQFTKGDLAGGWAWLNFHYEPWEADGSAYYGASLAAIAAGIAPGGYAASPEIQDRMKLLRDYLTRSAEKQHLFNRATLLWASTTWAGGAGGAGRVGDPDARSAACDRRRPAARSTGRRRLEHGVAWIVEAAGQHAARCAQRRLCHRARRVRPAGRGRSARQGARRACAGVAGEESGSGDGRVVRDVAEQAARPGIRRRPLHERCGDGVCGAGADEGAR